jgi:hypothetical protein
MDSRATWGLLALSLFLYGVKIIKDQEFSLGFGKGQPLFVITLRDEFALAMGICLIISAIVDAISILVVSAWSDIHPIWLNWIAVGGLLVLAFAFGLATIMQYAVMLGKWLGKQKRSEANTDDLSEVKH